MDSPSWVNQDRVEVRADHFEDQFQTKDINESMLRAIATSYYRYGNGPMSVLVSFNPQQKNSKANASNKAKYFDDILRANGVKDVTVTLVDLQQDQSTTRISFPALVAQAPQNCGLMPGLKGHTSVSDNANHNSQNYQFGCSVETMIANQVSRPGDLLGRPGFETRADGRRQDRVLDGRGYYDNKSFEPLDGESSTDE
jgi:type IV pilus biogenesis protein CpaD/CtpE